MLIHFIIAATGSLLVFINDIRNDHNWIGRHYNHDAFVEVIIEEPPVEKANSYKSIATVSRLISGDGFKKRTGHMIIYFKKDSSVKRLGYGSRLLLKRTLQPVKNSGNPGGFDYNRYCLFEGITHQVYLKADDYKVVPGQETKMFKSIIFQCREWVVRHLKKYIPGKKESGLAEALLIGYKDDLDKNLVQSYSNTGVIHVIAISGLHLGLIYGLLLLLTKPLKKWKRLAWLQFLLILLSLWSFTILAGAQPSVLRSAVMFSFIAMAEIIARKTSVYNTLALSAFLLLCYNPFWLWDVGFQLSYAAVFSIITFFKPIYNWFYFPNKLIDFIWKLNAVTLAAQILTTPFILFHFHQFPLLFIFTNLVAVPLSSIILIGEILLCAFGWVPLFTSLMGYILEKLIYRMNFFIELSDSLPFSVWKGFSITILQVFLLTGFLLSFCFWLMEKQRIFFWSCLTALICFTSIRTLSFIKAYQQKKFIVYNVPGLQAIDIVDGRKSYFMGDSSAHFDPFINNFHLAPSRILNRTYSDAYGYKIKSFELSGQHVHIIESGTLPDAGDSTDILILSKNPKISLSRIHRRGKMRQIVIDSSVPPWKARLWRKDCDSLGIPCHDVAEKGAFVMKL